MPIIESGGGGTVAGGDGDAGNAAGAVFIGRASFRMMPFTDNEWENEGSRSQHGEIRNRTVAARPEVFPSLADLADLEDMENETTVRGSEPTARSSEPPALEDLIVLVPPASVVQTPPLTLLRPGDTGETTAAGVQKLFERDVFDATPDASLVGPGLVAAGRRWGRSISEVVPVLPLVAALLAGVTLTVSAQAIMQRPDKLALAQTTTRLATTKVVPVHVPVTVPIASTAAAGEMAPAITPTTVPTPSSTPSGAPETAAPSVPAPATEAKPVTAPAIAFLPTPAAATERPASDWFSSQASKTAPARHRRGGNHAARASKRASSHWVDPFAPKPVAAKPATKPAPNPGLSGRAPSKTMTKTVDAARWVDPFAN